MKPLTIAELHLRAYDARCAVWDVLHDVAARIRYPWWQPWEDPREGPLEKFLWAEPKSEKPSVAPRDTR